MRNEKGFIFPFTLIISMLFTYFMLHQIELYNIDNKVINEFEELAILGSLIQIGTVDIISEIDMSVEPYNASGSFHYSLGTVTYSLNKISDTLLRVDVQSETRQNRIYSVVFVYDYSIKAVTKWLEG